MPSATLVIVDMQPTFAASKNPNTIIAIANEIILAKQKRHGIMIVEYSGSGQTYSGFDNLLRGYLHKAKIKKNDDDGSNEIIRALNRRNFPQQVLRVCGVNTDCCVHDTVVGLLRKLHKTKVEVIKDACNTESRFDWRCYYKHPNLRLV